MNGTYKDLIAMINNLAIIPLKKRMKKGLDKGARERWGYCIIRIMNMSQMS